MGKNWGYIEYDTIYKSSELMTRQLLEIVSKGGNLLLNNGPTGKGEITNLAQERLAQIGEWMKQNGEGVYGSKPWKVQGERLIKIQKSIKKANLSEEENLMKDNANDATSKDIFPEVRFTSKAGAVYAYVCSATENEVLIKSLSTKNERQIKSVTRLDTSEKVKWNQTDAGLVLNIPNYSENEIPITGFKIEF